MSNQNNVSVNMENLSSQERDQLLALIEKANKKPVKKKMFLQELEKPLDGETFYYMQGYGIPYEKEWTNTNTDTGALEQGNVFLSKEDAELVAKARVFKQKLRKACSDSWSDVEIEWGDSGQHKYYLYYDGCGFGVDYCCHNQSTPYLFHTKEHAKQFIDDNKDDMHLLFVE